MIDRFHSSCSPVDLSVYEKNFLVYFMSMILFSSPVLPVAFNPALINLNKQNTCTLKILKFGTPQTIAIIVLKIEKFDVTLH